MQIDPEVLGATWDGSQFWLFPDQSILVALEDEARWTTENKLTEAARVPNYFDYFHTKALLAVKPEVVTIVGRKR